MESLLLQDVIHYLEFIRTSIEPAPEMEMLKCHISQPYKFTAIGEKNGILSIKGAYELLLKEQDAFLAMARLETGHQRCHAGYIDLGTPLNEQKNSYHLLTAHHCVSTFSFRPLVDLLSPIGLLLLLVLAFEKLRTGTWRIPKIPLIYWIAAFCWYCYSERDYLSISMSPIIFKNQYAAILGECKILESLFFDDIALIRCTSQTPIKIFAPKLPEKISQ
jgi:hypothetical protein